MKSEMQRGGHEGGWRAQGVGRAPYLVGPSWVSWPNSFAYIYSYTLKTSRGATKTSTAGTFCTREIPYAAFSSDLLEGDSIMEGFYINTIASPMMCE